MFTRLGGMATSSPTSRVSVPPCVPTVPFTVPKPKPVATTPKRKGRPKGSASKRVKTGATPPSKRKGPTAASSLAAAATAAALSISLEDPPAQTDSEPEEDDVDVDEDLSAEDDEVEATPTKSKKKKAPATWTDVAVPIMFPPCDHVNGWRPPDEDSRQNRRLGPRNIMRDAGGIPTPGYITKLFWPDDLLQRITTASSTYSHHWHVMGTTSTKEDILRFFLCVVRMGIITMPALKMYWATSTLHPTITRLVPTLAEFKRFCVDIRSTWWIQACTPQPSSRA